MRRSTFRPQSIRPFFTVFALLLAALAPAAVTAQQPAPAVNPALFGGLNWRLVGPWRGGKTTTVTGVNGNPHIYYFGTAGSGVWKTTDGGQTWQCVSDSHRLAGIASVAAAPTNGDIVYVAPGGGGGGGAAGGAGLLRSTDGGKTWDQVIEGQSVASIVVNARDPNSVVTAGSAGLNHSSDGGKTWQNTLAQDGLRGQILAAAPDNPQIVYAGVAAGGGGRGGAGGGGGRAGAGGTAPSMTAAEAAAHPAEVYISSDGGATWKPASEIGLPPGGHGTLGLAVAPGTNGQRAYLYMTQGIWRTDNGGASWTRATDDPRMIGGGQFHSIYVDPRDANILYATQTSFYRSLDGGKTWDSWTGAPSGADFNNLWIDPVDDQDMIVGADQGTEITMNGGKSYTTWFNQPTGQLYNVVTDHRFPFTMFSAQQDSGTIATPIRANDGEITYRDWYTTNGFETAKIQPDPADPNIIYSTGWYDSILRMDRRTGQTQHILEVRDSKYRSSGSPPMGFSPFDDHTLYVGTQFLLRTSDNGRHWSEASPDLSVAIGAEAAAPAAPAAGRGGRGGAGAGAITSIAFSPATRGEIWVGTSNGLIQLTKDNGQTWVTVKAPVPGNAIIEASHRAGRAYAIIGGGGGRGGGGGAAAAAGAAPPPGPGIYRTDDDGQTWTLANGGLPPGNGNALREDSVNTNLLFLSTPAAVYVSFNAGHDWQSLELNLPNGSNRDLALEQSTLVVATYGRALWAIDDIGPLRALADPAMAATASSAPAILYPPTPAIRTQWDTYTDTPINPDVAMSANPPDGAVLDYYLKATPSSDIRLAIYDAKGGLVREYSSRGDSHLAYKVNVPDFWLAPADLLPTAPGHHRFVWNLRYPDPPALLYTYYGVHSAYFEYTLADHAIPGNTPWHEPEGPLVVPGEYQVRLTVDGKTYTQPLKVSEDPRVVNVSQADLERQLSLSLIVSNAMSETNEGYNQADAILHGLAAKPASDAITTLSTALKVLTDGSINCAVNPTNPADLSFGPTNCALSRYLIAIDQADTAPTDEVESTFQPLCLSVNAEITQLADLTKQAHAIDAALVKTAPALAPLTCRQP